MKIKANSSSFSSYESAKASRRLSLVLSLGVSVLMLSNLAMADGATRRELREFGFAGAYTGVIRGNIFSRTNASASFTVVPVSKLSTERLPQGTRQRIESPFGSGTTYPLYVKTIVNRRRAVIRGLYYGESFNPALAATTIRTGSKILQVDRNGRTGFLSPMILKDSMTEYNSSGVILGKWKYKGSLEK